MDKIFNENISVEELTQLPLVQFGGEIVVVDDEGGLKDACDYLLRQPMVGFDTETRPTFKAGELNKVALLQLSTFDHCFLFRLCSMRLDKAIIKIIENNDILKIGADVKGDLRALQRLRHFKPDGFIDLQSIVSEWGVAEKSVRKMAAIILGMRVSKAQRLSNWEAVSLTTAQQLYAATDAWVCLEIFNKINSIPKL